MNQRLSVTLVALSLACALFSNCKRTTAFEVTLQPGEALRLNYEGGLHGVSGAEDGLSAECLIESRTNASIELRGCDLYMQRGQLAGTVAVSVASDSPVGSLEMAVAPKVCGSIDKYGMPGPTECGDGDPIAVTVRVNGPPFAETLGSAQGVWWCGGDWEFSELDKQSDARGRFDVTQRLGRSYSLRGSEVGWCSEPCNDRRAASLRKDPAVFARQKDGGTLVYSVFVLENGRGCPLLRVRKNGTDVEVSAPKAAYWNECEKLRADPGFDDPLAPTPRPIGAHETHAVAQPMAGAPPSPSQWRRCVRAPEAPPTTGGRRPLSPGPGSAAPR